MLRFPFVSFLGLDPLVLLVNLVVLFFSLSLHESAHAWSAERFGDPTGRLLGRVSLNPLVHVDPIGTVVFPLVGMLSGGVIFGWAKPVPVDTSRLRDPKKAQMIVSAAGPLSNLLAAVVFGLGLRILLGLPAGFASWLAEPLQLILRSGLYLNVILAVFNLLPIPPLDGSWILSGLLPKPLDRVVEMVRPFGFLLLLLFLFSGLFSAVLRPVMSLLEIVAL